MMSPMADRQLQTQGMGAALVKGKSGWGNIFILSLFSEGQLLWWNTYLQGRQAKFGCSYRRRLSVLLAIYSN